MKILFDNVLDNAVFSSTDSSANYPADNLVDAFLHKRYQHTADEYATVTVLLPYTQIVTSVFFSYSNVAQIVIRLYDSGSNLLTTETFYGVQDTRVTSEGDTRVTSGGDIRITQEPFAVGQAVHFDSVYYVAEIQVDVYGGSGGYLGGLAAGKSEEFPDPVNPWDEPFTDHSSVTANLNGQGLQRFVEPLRRYSWTFRDITRERLNALRGVYAAHGTGARIWIDPFESDHDFMAPMYCRIAEPPPVWTKQNNKNYQMTWAFEEAR